MNDFIKDTTEIPSLSFGAPEPEPELPVQQPEEKKEVMDDSVLSDEQKAMVDAFVSQIDLANTNGILQYGAGAQKKMADFSEKTLENVRSKDLGEIGDLLTSVVTELKTFDAEEEKGPFSFFKKSTNKLNAMKAKYDKAEVNVNKICDVLDGHQRQLLKDIAILDQMFFFRAACDADDRSSGIWIPVRCSKSGKCRDDIDTVRVLHFFAVFFGFCRMIDHTQIIAKPLNGCSCHKNAAFQCVLYLIVNSCCNRSQQSIF